MRDRGVEVVISCKFFVDFFSTPPAHDVRHLPYIFLRKHRGGYSCLSSLRSAGAEMVTYIGITGHEIFYRPGKNTRRGVAYSCFSVAWFIYVFCVGSSLSELGVHVQVVHDK